MHNHGLILLPSSSINISSAEIIKNLRIITIFIQFNFTVEDWYNNQISKFIESKKKHTKNPTKLEEFNFSYSILLGCFLLNPTITKCLPTRSDCFIGLSLLTQNIENKLFGINQLKL